MNKNWKKFMKSGSVEDYLKYKECYAKEEIVRNNEKKGNNNSKNN